MILANRVEGKQHGYTEAPASVPIEKKPSHDIVLEVKKIDSNT